MERKKNSLRTRLLIWVVSIVLAGFTATVVILTNRAADLQHQTAMAYAEQLAQNSGSQIAERIDHALDAAQVLADAMASMRAAGQLDRDAANNMLKGVLASNGEFLAVWSGWEPDALDGKDSLYASQAGHDASGRFVPYWNRGAGKLAVEPLVDYDQPGAGDYYLLAKQRRQPVLLEPYIYKVGGKDTLITTLTVPILVDGRFLGVTGIDIALSDLQQMVGAISIYDSGYASLLSHDGQIVGDRDARNVGQDMARIGLSEEGRNAVRAGKPYTTLSDDERLGVEVRRLYMPVQIGDTAPWSFVVTVPEGEILAAIGQLRLLAAILGLLSIVLVSLGLSLALERLVLRPIGGDPEDAASITNRIAEGDLSQTIVLRHGDASSLMANLKHMQNSLLEVVGHVRQGAQSLAVASAQISQANADLSARTESQASALEQTSASMEQLGSTVQQNAESANQTNRLSVSAAEVATRGGEVVERVVGTMKAIHDSSREIAEIIGVIDSIAFQTNILALNAAVEAARAGDQGRGFAVVASEVRALAQRSADAANEVKQLVGANVERVNAGSSLADQAGSTMSEVVEAIQRVTDIMGEISAASAEQSAGVSQIGLAVTQMDQATQQNAALVQEMAAAAHNLKGQAEELVQTVAVFKVA